MGKTGMSDEIIRNDCQDEDVADDDAIAIAYMLGRDDGKKTATADISAFREQVKGWLEMTVNCAGIPNNPDSLPQMLIAEFRAFLAKAEPKP